MQNNFSASDGPFVVVLFGVIESGPFNSYAAARRALLELPEWPCSCGCGRDDNPATIVAI